MRLLFIPALCVKGISSQANDSGGFCQCKQDIAFCYTEEIVEWVDFQPSYWIRHLSINTLKH